MKENQIRELVNELRDIAIEYHGTQQLRERIARTVRAAIIQAGNSPSKCSLRDGIEAIRNSGIPVDVDKIQSECEACNSPVIPGGWISCSERMPDREYVLAGDFSGTHYLASIPNVQVGIYADWFDDEKPCWDDGDGNDLHLKEVTHWMPLPEPPQEVK